MKNLSKNYTYKNRGMWLEKVINDSNTFYIFQDLAIIYKKPTPIKVLDVTYPDRKHTVIEKAVFSETSTLDYNGIYKGKYIEFDAKECKNNTSFPLSNIKNHQLKHIRNIINHGGIVFLIIFMNNEFTLLKGEDLIKFINNNDRKSIPYQYLKEKGKKISEKFNPKLDYLKIVDKFYFEEEN